MSRSLLALGSLALLVAFASCSEDAVNSLGPDDGLVLAAKGGVKGKPGGGGGGDGGGTSVTIDMTGGYEMVAQPGTVVSDNRNRSELGGPGDCDPTFGCVDYAFDFSDKVDLAACTTDPADIDPALEAELYARLADPIQNRTFSAVVEKRGAPKTKIGAVYIDDANGRKYKIEIRDASAAEGPTDHYVVTGGIVWTVKDGFGAYLICPFTGSQELTVTR